VAADAGRALRKEQPRKMRSPTKAETVKRNLEFVYGKTTEQEKHLDPDKATHRKSKPKYLDPNAIVTFAGEFDFLAPSFPCRVFLAGEVLPFPSFEHALLASKFKTADKRAEVRATAQVRDVKRLISREKGRGVHADWADNCLQLAEALLLDKFCRNKQLRAKLVGTGRRLLLFGNDFGDCYWGVDAESKGHNHLGRLLGKVRALANTGADLDSWIGLHAKPVAAEKARVHLMVSKDGARLESDCRTFDALPRLSIGKGEDCEVLAAHPTVSRLHALLVVTAQGPVLVDLGSSNGTHVAGVRLEAFVPTPLPPLAQVTLGASERSYCFTADAAAEQMRRLELLQKVADAGVGGGGGGGADAGEEQRNTVFVGNLPFDAGEAEVRAFFAPCGSITQLSLPRDRASGEGRGIAFLTFSDFKGTMQALAKDGDELQGRSVVVKKSDARKPTTTTTTTSAATRVGGRGGGERGGGERGRDAAGEGALNRRAPDTKGADSRGADSRGDARGGREERRDESRDVERDRSRSRSRGRDGGKGTDRGRDGDARDSRDRHSGREWHREDSRDRDRDRDRDRGRDRDRDRGIDRDRERDRDKDRDRDKGRGRGADTGMYRDRVSGNSPSPSPSRRKRDRS
jgi:predicted NAD-dependent protein-ADP-ribosyltransferase YbiA (DUF1768 family)/RNA recognition motif-containing protein